MSTENPTSHKPLRTFGRRTNRMTLADQDTLATRLDAYALTFNTDGSADLAASFPQHNADTPLVVELGMGNGEMMLHRAEQAPSARFVGAEVFQNGLRLLERGLRSDGISNVRLYPEDGRGLLTALPDGSVSELLVLYPDPWPKKKHNKRRLVQQDFLDEAARVLAPSGTLFLATDVPDYMMWMLSEIYTHQLFRPTALGAQEWATPPTWWTPTAYEKKARKMGRQSWYLTFRKDVLYATTKCETL